METANEPPCLLGQISEGDLFPQNTSFLQAARGSRASWAWLSLLHGRDLLKKGLKWQAQSGRNIDFWGDSWVPSLPGFKLSSTKPANSCIDRVCDVIDSRKRQWDKQKLAGKVSAIELEAILDLSLPVVDRVDQLVWHFSSNGIYSVNQSMTKRKENPEPSFKPSKVVWKMKAPNKVKNFWWRVCKNSLATKENMFRRRCAPSNSCPICDLEVDVEHLLSLCPWTNWFGSNISPLGNLGGNASSMKWTAEIVERMESKEASEFLGLIAQIAWNIWKARNDCVFKGKRVNPLELLASIRFSSLEFTSIQEISQVHMDNLANQTVSHHWRALDSGNFKINCDAVVPLNKKEGRIAGVLRNCRGLVLNGFGRTVKVCSSLRGKLLAIRDACLVAVNLGLKGVEVESDNKQAILLSVSDRTGSSLGFKSCGSRHSPTRDRW